ncbi:alpha/beta fold hydrolase [Stutzerimonas xanthomarina]|uniref:alpha/beta fold hydrolase n=1 Tax=Stutzerimonas xanthomarina TaxID=271420 RepID=UPI003AA81821
MKKTIIISVLAASIVGCSSFEANLESENRLDDSARLHTLYIDRNGNLLDPVSGNLVVDSKNHIIVHREEQRYSSRILENFKDMQKKNPSLRLTLFVHGGLNEFKTATRRSKELTADMLLDGQYPVFICWDSGPFTNYFDHLFRIRKGLNRPVAGALSSPIVLVEDAARSLARFPAAAYKQVADPLTVAKSINTVDEYNYQIRSRALADLGFSVHSEAPFVGVRNSYWTVFNPVKFITGPFVDGLGSGSWNSMLRRADLVLTKKQAYEGQLPESKSAKTEPAEEQPRYADTAATKFLRSWTAESALSDVKVDLIGHSMGTIVSADILVRHPELNVKNLVFMGAAAKVKDIENIVVPWMQRPAQADAVFFNLSLDPYREISENTFYDFLPRGSLLNWIDFTFGSVNSYKDRTAGSWWNIVRTAEDIFPGSSSQKQLRRRVHLTRFGIGGAEEGPQKHGDFGDYCFWRQDFWLNKKPQVKFPLCANQPMQSKANQ